MNNKQQQQQFAQIARDPLAFLITAVGGTSKPRPCDENDHVAFTPKQHAAQRKTAAVRRMERKGKKTSQRARAHQAAICQRLGSPTPFQKGLRQ